MNTDQKEEINKLTTELNTSLYIIISYKTTNSGWKPSEMNGVKLAGSVFQLPTMSHINKSWWHNYAYHIYTCQFILKKLIILAFDEH